MTSNFNVYISASILAHLLLISILSMTNFHTETSLPVFNVNLAGPAEELTPPPDTIPQEPEQILKKPVPNTRKPVLLKRKRKAPDKTLVPEALLGEGTSAEKKTKEKRAASKEEKIEDNSTENRNSVTSRFREKSEKSGTMLAPPSSLFDKNTIEKYARKNTPPVDKGLTFEAPEFKHRGYMRMLKERIEDIWKYPKEAAERGISGDLYIKFIIKKNGRLENVKLLRTSGYQDLDEAALEAVKKIFPFFPLPINYDKETLTITGHFIYIYGNAILL